MNSRCEVAMGIVSALLVVHLVGCESGGGPTIAPVEAEPQPGPAPSVTPRRDVTIPPEANTVCRLDWVVRLGNGGDAEQGHVATAPDGGVVLAARFGGSVTLGEGTPQEVRLVAGAADDTFIAKYTVAGVLEWSAQISNSRYVVPSGIGMGPDGQVAITGTMTSDVVLTPTTTGIPLELVHQPINGVHDQYVALLDAQGRFVWATSVGGQASNDAGGATIGLDGAVYINGSFANGGTTVGLAADAVYLPNDSDQDHAFVARFEPDGAVGWVRTIAGEDFESALDLAANSAGGVVAAGTFQGDLDLSLGEPDQLHLDPGFQSPGPVLAYLVSYNATGELQWARTPGSIRANEFPRAFASSGSEFLMGGNGGAGAVFGVGEPNEFTMVEAFSGYYVAYEPNGDLSYGRYVASPENYAESRGITGKPDGSVAVGGTVLGEFSFPTPGDAPNITQDTPGVGEGPFAATYLPNGDLQCLWIHDGSYGIFDEVSSVAFDNANGLYMTGFFRDALAIDDGQGGTVPLMSVGSEDLFFAHYTLVEPPSE